MSDVATATCQQHSYEPSDGCVDCRGLRIRDLEARLAATERRERDATNALILVTERDVALFEARCAELERENHRGNVLVHDLAAENEMLRQANLTGKPAFLRQIDTDSQKRAEAAEARVKVLEEALHFTSEQHCPENPETALGRTLRMLIDHARQALQSVAREEGET